jgi:predicted RNase H-like HicB family nuclease
VGEWCGWINGLPGVYAQGESVEIVRQELAEMVEEHDVLV